MKKTILVSVALWALCLVSCSQLQLQRTVTVVIPDHPWEAASGTAMWYTLRWTNGENVESVYVPSDERSVTITVPPGETILVAAYPLGDMNPFGGCLTPMDSRGTLVLNQNDGYIVSLLLNTDRLVTRELNYQKVRSVVSGKMDDFRCLDSVVFLRDLQNGELNSTSCRKVALWGISPMVVPNGLWISEYSRDQMLVVTDNTTAALQLPEGVFRYLNTEMDRVLVLIVDSGGNQYSYLKQSLL